MNILRIDESNENLLLDVETLKNELLKYDIKIENFHQMNEYKIKFEISSACDDILIDNIKKIAKKLSENDFDELIDIYINLFSKTIEFECNTNRESAYKIFTSQKLKL